MLHVCASDKIAVTLYPQLVECKNLPQTELIDTLYMYTALQIQCRGTEAAAWKITALLNIIYRAFIVERN